MKFLLNPRFWRNPMNVVFVGVFLFIGGGIIYNVLEFRARRACLRHGYPQVNFSPTGPAYCIKRANQTDVVAPLDSLEGAR